MPPRTVKMFALHCLKCNHRWTTRKGHMPKVCPRCKRPDYLQERRDKKYSSDTP
jgi:hypothetical protein